MEEDGLARFRPINRFQDSFQKLLDKTMSGKVYGVCFLEILGDDEMPFDNLYCVDFRMMDVEWLAKCASYMEFNVLKSTRTQLEHELALDDTSSVKGLSAYNILNVVIYRLIRRHKQPFKSKV